MAAFSHGALLHVVQRNELSAITPGRVADLPFGSCLTRKAQRPAVRRTDCWCICKCSSCSLVVAFAVNTLVSLAAAAAAVVDGDADGKGDGEEELDDGWPESINPTRSRACVCVCVCVCCACSFSVFLRRWVCACFLRILRASSRVISAPGLSASCLCASSLRKYLCKFVRKSFSMHVSLRTPLTQLPAPGGAPEFCCSSIFLAL